LGLAVLGFKIMERVGPNRKPIKLDHPVFVQLNFILTIFFSEKLTKFEDPFNLAPRNHN